MTERAEYDAIGDRYSEAKTAPWWIHLEAHTLERFGDVAGARVLDLACGDGLYFAAAGRPHRAALSRRSTRGADR